jgi:hypothetical protein
MFLALQQRHARRPGRVILSIRDEKVGPSAFVSSIFEHMRHLVVQRLDIRFVQALCSFLTVEQDTNRTRGAIASTQNGSGLSDVFAHPIFS